MKLIPVNRALNATGFMAQFVLRAKLGLFAVLVVLVSDPLAPAAPARSVVPSATLKPSRAVSIAVDSRSRPDGFGTDGIPGPVIDLSMKAGPLELDAAGSWCRFGVFGCSGPGGDVPTTGVGPLPNQSYNLLGGEWQGGASDGIRFAIGTSLDTSIPFGATGLQLFFNDDINNYADNTGSITLTYTAYEVVDTQWVALNSPLTSNAHPSGTEGLRVFPGKASPTDGVARDIVKIEATLSPPEAAVTVYFKLYDPDDPSSDDTKVDWNGADFDDNTGNGSLQTASATTNGSGKASVVLETSMYPGDNFRVAASLAQADLTALPSVEADDSQVPGFKGKITPLLTIWRKLHLEVDSMKKEPDGVVRSKFPDVAWSSTDRILSVTRNAPARGFSRIVLDSRNPAFVVRSFYEGGLLRVNGVPDFVISNSRRTWKVFVIRPSGAVLGGQISRKAQLELTIVGVPTAPQVAQLLGSRAEIRDDDSTTPQLPVTSLNSSSTVDWDAIVGWFSSAYILIEEVDSTFNPRSLVEFNLNLDSLNAILEANALVPFGFAASRDLEMGDEGYWVDHIVMCYQPGESVDGDPDFYNNSGFSANEYGLGFGGKPYDKRFKMGITYRPLISKSPHSSAIFVETIRDTFIDASSDPIALIIAHEIGHAPDSNGEKADHMELGLMRSGSNPSLANTKFTAATLGRFRSATEW